MPHVPPFITPSCDVLECSDIAARNILVGSDLTCVVLASLPVAYVVCSLRCVLLDAKCLILVSLGRQLVIAVGPATVVL
jgi:hypothetical protein